MFDILSSNPLVCVFPDPDSSLTHTCWSVLYRVHVGDPLPISGVPSVQRPPSQYCLQDLPSLASPYSQLHPLLSSLMGSAGLFHWETQCHDLKHWRVHLICSPPLRNPYLLLQCLETLILHLW